MPAKCPHLSHCVPQWAPVLSHFMGEDNARNFLAWGLTGQQCVKRGHLLGRREDDRVDPRIKSEDGQDEKCNSGKQRCKFCKRWNGGGNLPRNAIILPAAARESYNLKPELRRRLRVPAIL